MDRYPQVLKRLLLIINDDVKSTGPFKIRMSGALHDAVKDAWSLFDEAECNCHPDWPSYDHSADCPKS